ncbi:KGG domain-containing protein [Duganella callida]|uniref:Stress-induced protein n=1 Tax=Duganella callida TaxID=2561932 RepID=A0A4Y9S604_9BURK|nr:KGG domain-containing protein [Duganella callida]TFW16794.1 hypothetical protein E4L98_22345 [Duganella callida]
MANSTRTSPQQEGTKQSGSGGNRGFAGMDPQRQREIAAAGGRAAHASGNAHQFTSEEARRAGRLSHKGSGNLQAQQAVSSQSADGASQQQGE